jgi:predicted dehydrogenase
MDRRVFLQSATAATAALSASRVLGANERLGVGFIGYGLIGKRHVLDFKEQPDVNIVAVAEAHRGRLDEGAALAGGSVRKYGDFRRLLDDKDVHAVVISTPDHWHALMTMMACAAGKDVYVEKPLTLFVREGRWMIDVARRCKRVVQVGTQQRSGPHYHRAKELIQGGHIGKVVSVRMQSCRNVMPGWGTPPDCDPPADLDWEMFLGPAPQRRYNPNRGIYHFRWFWDYSGGQMTNLGAHSLDIVDWFLGPLVPRAVASFGGRFALKDNGETPDTQDALFDFGDWTAAWTLREAAKGPPAAAGLEFFGRKGSLAISRSGFVLTPDRRVPPANAVPQFTGAHPVGGPAPVKEDGPPPLWTEAVEDRSGDTREQFRRHARSFLECVKSRKQPVSDLESAHRVTTACHLANIALRLGRQVRWDAQNERIIGNPLAAGMLERPYRAPWDAVLAGFLKG